MDGGNKNAYCRSKRIIDDYAECYGRICKPFTCGVKNNYYTLYIYGSDSGLYAADTGVGASFMCEDP